MPTRYIITLSVVKGFKEAMERIYKLMLSCPNEATVSLFIIRLY